MMKRRRLVFVCDAEWCGMVRNGIRNPGFNAGRLPRLCIAWRFVRGGNLVADSSGILPFFRNSSIFPEFFHFSGILSFFLILDFFLHSPPLPRNLQFGILPFPPEILFAFSRNPECGIRNCSIFPESGIPNPESGIIPYFPNPECRIHNPECGIRNAESGIFPYFPNPESKILPSP